MAAETLRVRADTAELARVRRQVDAWAAAARLDSARAARLRIAVDETVANAIEHGLADGARVVVRGTPGRGRLTVTVRYRGDRFDPTAAPIPSARETLARRSEHGYGLHLIRLVDDVSYRWDHGSNELRLTTRNASR